MAETLFGNATPAIADQLDSGVQYTLGTVFEADAAGTVTGIRWMFPLTLPPATVIGVLYSFTSDGAGVELARSNFVAPTAGAWNVATFAAPVAVDPSPARYVAAIWTSERYVATNGGLTGAITNGSHLTAPANGPGLRNGRFIVGASPAYPDNGGGTLYFADVVFEPAATTPGPAAVALTGVPPASAVGAPSATPGAVAVALTGAPSASGVGAPSIALGAVTVALVSVPSASAVGAPTAASAAQDLTVTLTGVPSASKAGAPTVGGSGAAAIHAAPHRISMTSSPSWVSTISSTSSARRSV